ncbi:M23 family metallopeptidase [Sphingomonas sp.]|jgi:murein DD-endopeptidase MepM/ murein hydrolase activator NlpD|uniref:M23 family metallopeptidase n=1 Tax=Sphingomonas sp. TaxID=28214 RepID=UPI002D7F7D3A|nr:M23 family metallopeptidase [Sphingomonas sp.]HEU0045202.1 M23 family metallopeptidase [Sphingomonas sp.]
MIKASWIGAVLLTVGATNVAAANEAGGAVGVSALAAASVETRSQGMSNDNQVRAAFLTWKKLDTAGAPTIAIPSVQPVDKLHFTSNFGVRSDPFVGTARMHAGVDIPGAVGTPIYATADGIVAHADRKGAYGKLVELDHGKGIATRYGHLSQITVQAGSRVTRGQIIGLMGSTGRSTGSHLHYEVRIDGAAVNPLPFLTTADFLTAASSDAVRVVPISTDGPAPLD